MKRATRRDDAPPPPGTAGDGFAPYVVTRASAGTGKTHALSTRMIRLLADGALPEEVFAATFARKAAGEILARVLERLAEAADAPAAAAALAGSVGRPGAPPTFFRDLLVAVTASIDRLAVGTLDSFFVRCADAARYELGLPPGFSIGSEPDLLRLRRRAIRATVEEALSAGAAGGATPATVLANLMVQLSGGSITSGLEQQIERVVTDLAALHRDTEPSAWEWLPVPKPPSMEAVEAARDTLAGIDFGDKRLGKARDGALEALAAFDVDALVSKGMIPKLLAGETTFSGKPIPAAAIEPLETLAALARHLIVARAVMQTRAIRDVLDRFAAVSQRLVQSEGLVSFDDVTRMVGTAAGDGTLDAARWRGIRFPRHLLLDEFQDTSPPQWRVLERLAEHAITSQGSFFAVGDGKQAIYGWRGGAAELFDALPDFFADVPGGLVTETLAESWRSGPAVLGSVNRLFGRLAGCAALAEYTGVAADAVRAFSEHVPAPPRADTPGWVRLRTCPQAGETETPRDVLVDTAARRAAALARANPGRTVGVLVRTNAAAERVIAALKADGIVAGAEGGQPLDDSPAVEIVLSALHLLDHPGDSRARFHVGTSALAGAFGLDGPGTVAKDPPAGFLDRVVGLRRALVDEGYGPVMARLAAPLLDVGSPRDRRRLEQLVAAAWRHDEGSVGEAGLSRTGTFIEACRTLPVVDPVASPIRVMTIHKAKGLEFDIVVLSDLDRPMVTRPPRVDIERRGPLEPVRRVLVHLSESCRAVLPRDWQARCDAAADPVVREAIATLYVGMTRAARALEIVIQPAAATQKKVPQSLAGVLRTTLPEDTAAPPDTVLFALAHRADAALDRLPDTPDTPAPPPPPPADRAAIRLRPPSGRRSRPLRTPSSAEGGRRVPTATLLDPGSRAARDLGTLFHAWIECFGWPPVAPSDATLRALSPRDLHLAPQLDTFLADFRRMCAAPAVERILAEPPHELPAGLVGPDLPAGPAEPELLREQAFAIDEGEGTLLGVVDRIVVWRRGGIPVAAEVVDFKFDGMGGPDATAAQRAEILAAKQAYYAPQLLAYRTAVATLFGIPPGRVTLALVFMRGATVVPVAG